jgi:hypothetical protein
MFRKNKGSKYVKRLTNLLRTDEIEKYLGCELSKTFDKDPIFSKSTNSEIIVKNIASGVSEFAGYLFGYIASKWEPSSIDNFIEKINNLHSEIKTCPSRDMEPFLVRSYLQFKKGYTLNPEEKLTYLEVKQRYAERLARKLESIYRPVLTI